MGRKIVAGAAVLLFALAASIAILHPHPQLLSKLLRWDHRGCAFGSSQHTAYRNDVRFISHLGDNLVHLTDAQESISEVLQKLSSYSALVVVTAGHGGPTRRADGQPFISITNSGSQSGCATAQAASGSAQGEGMEATAPGNCDQQPGDGLLAALRVPLQVMNTAAAGVERVLGRRLFPITISTFDRGATGPYAIFDASAGALLLDRQLVASTWAYDKPEVSYITGELSRRVFESIADLLRTASTTRSDDMKAADADNAPVSTTGDTDGAADAVAAAVPSVGGLPDLLSGLLLRGGKVSTGYEGLAQSAHSSHAELPDAELEQEQDAEESSDPEQLPRRQAQEQEGSADSNFSLPALLSQLPDPSSSGTALPASAAAAAAGLAAAALAVALPAAFASAPPLWFCVLCPSVLGLLAPVLINVALNQVAGALCSQLHLDDNACFDVLLGALGAGFVLSLASAVPIFFVCRLPECAGRNVTAALRAVRQAF